LTTQLASFWPIITAHAQNAYLRASGQKS